MENNGTTFISYSHDSVDHVNQVLALSNRLRSDGIDCVLDQYEVAPPEGWPRWMDSEIRKSEFVLMICTENYFNRVMGREEPGVGLGVKWEGNLIYQYLYNSGTINTKFVPVLLNEADRHFIPTPLQGTSYFVVSQEDGYEDLYKRLLNQPKAVKPDLGKRRPLAKKEVKTDVSMFITGPINVELWDKAKWRGTFYFYHPDRIPVFGLGFKNESAAREIFKGWHRRYGERDEYEELRVAVIEGDIKGEDPGYTVHVGTNWKQVSKRLEEHGFQSDRDYLMCISRMNRMNPPSDSKNLEMFKELYRRTKSYLLIPGILSEDKTQVKPIFELGILKGSVIFKNVDDIGENDEDKVVLKTGDVDR